MAAVLVTLMWGTAAFAVDRASEAGRENRAEAATRGSQNAGSQGEGNSGTRGKSPSEPDQDGIGMDRGIVNDDKPPSGDGNNGCGNDVDREDDNNGWCGAKPVSSPTSVATETPEVAPTTVAAAGDEAEVLGKVVTRSEAPHVLGALARTGLTLLGLIVAGLALTAGGTLLARRSS